MLFALGVGIYYSKRASKSPEEYYLAGRSLPWWVVGTSIVATTFAADTPLAITEMSRSKGIWENWFWWSWLLYGLLAVFLFSRLWRRAGVLTENELIELRYSGKPAAFLRAFKAGYFAILYNFIVLGWVIKGMASVLTVMLGLPAEHTQWVIVGLVVLSVVYCLLSGFWGVVMTDVVQFVIAMIGAIALAYAALNHEKIGGIDGLKAGLDEVLPTKIEAVEQKIAEKQGLFDSLSGTDRGNGIAAFQAEIDGLTNDAKAMEGEELKWIQAEIERRSEFLKAVKTGGEDSEQALSGLEGEIKALHEKKEGLPRDSEEMLNLVPKAPPGFEWNKLSSWTSEDFLNSKFFGFLVFLLVLWWSNHSADGGGYTVQRTMAAKDERHAFGANLWYNFAMLAVRTWPWVVVALCSVVIFPEITDIKNVAIQDMGEQAGYPLVMKEVLGSGLRGLLIVSFLAAFMSTVDTHLNWASSYLVHDIYRRFLQRTKPEGHYVLVARIVTLVLMVVAAILSRYIDRIDGAWKFVIAMGSGIGLVLILRWFWWRINAWSEIVALGISVVMAIGFEVIAKLEYGASYKLFGSTPHIGGILFSSSLQLISIVAVALTSWIVVTFLTKPTDRETLRKFYGKVQPGGWWGTIRGDVTVTHAPVGRGFIFNFIAGIALIWGATFSIGYLIFKNWVPGITLALVALAGWWWIWRSCIAPMRNEKVDSQD